MINNTAKELYDIYGISEILRVNQPSQAQQAPETPAVKPSGWDELKKAVATCTKCPLSAERQNTVFGEGDQNARLMFIGEGPGADEDAQGRPFVGKAGQLLTKMINAMGFTREQVYIANIVKCRPPGNREPFQEEVNACIGFLYNQIELVKPEIIICLGSTAAVHLLKTGLRISHLRGKFQNYNGIKVMPTFHPSYLLRNESKKRDVWNDLKLVMNELGLSKQ